MRVDWRSALVSLTLYLFHLPSWPLFLVGFWLIGLPWPVDALVLALAAANSLTEVRTFRRVLDRVADVVNNGLPPEIEAPVDWDAD